MDIFTDASLIKNNNNYFIGYGVRFPNGEFNDIVDSIDVQINNADIHYAELFGIYMAIFMTKNNYVGNIYIYTDSMHSVNAIYKWINIYYMYGIKKMVTNKNNPIKNRDILAKIFDLLCGSHDKYVFLHVKAHTRSAEYKYVNNRNVDIMVRKYVRSQFNKNK